MNASSAPLSGFLTKYFSVRQVVLAGSFLFSAGSCACFFSTDTFYVSAFFGVLRGTGLAMASTPIPGLINTSFKKHRGTAMGIATTGTPLGGFVLPLVVQELLEVYSLNGTFLLLGGICLHAVVGSMLLVDYNAKKPKQPGVDNRGFQATDEGGATGPEVVPVNGNAAFQTSHVTPLEAINASQPDYGDANRLESRSRGVDNRGFESDNATSMETSGKRRPGSYTIYGNEKGKAWKQSKKDPRELLYVTNFTGDLSSDGSPYETEVQNTQVTENKTLSKEPKNALLNSMKVIFTTRGFYVVTLTNVCMTFLAGNYTLVMVDYAQDKGIDRWKGVYLLTLNAVGEIVGRLALGWITDHIKGPKQAMLFCSTLATAGLITGIAFVDDFAALMTIAVLFGMLQGAGTNLAYVVLVEYVRREDMHLAISFIWSIVGMSFLPRAPFIGFFRDKLNSYDYLFVSMGGLFCLASVLWLMEILLQHCKQRKSNTAAGSGGPSCHNPI